MAESDMRKTVREILVSEGSLPDITFDDWCGQLRQIAASEPLRYGPDPIDACGPECWRDYYDDGYTSGGAWAEDGTYD